MLGAGLYWILLSSCVGQCLNGSTRWQCLHCPDMEPICVYIGGLRPFEITGIKQSRCFHTVLNICDEGIRAVVAIYENIALFA
jgi:hypothetical protein